MILVNKGNVEASGKGAEVLAELSFLIATLNRDVPHKLLLTAIAVGLNMEIEEAVSKENQKLADDFIRELMKKVEERRNAQTNKGNSNT